MTSLPLHSITEGYADLTDVEATAMRASLEANGLAVPIVVWHGQVVDGRHRAMFCRELGIEPHYVDISDRCPTEEAMRRHVIALNERRRARTTPLTNREKRDRIAAELKADPGQSDRAIAETVGVHNETVGAVRAKLEQEGGVTVSVTRTDTSGRKQPAKKSKWNDPAKCTPAGSKSTPAAVSISTGSKRLAPTLNSLSWVEASLEARQRFISDVGPRSLWECMTEGQRDVWAECHNKWCDEMGAANAACQTASAAQ
jgi:hypothetical protein